MNFTKHNLKKLETLFEELGYLIRYEKGSFNSGYCIVEARKIIVINRFFETDGRMSILLDVLKEVKVGVENLSDKSAKTYEAAQKLLDQKTET